MSEADLLGGLVALGLIGIATLVGRAAAAPPLPGLERALSARMAPTIVGVLTALSVWWVWGSLDAIAVVHDEIAYLLQAAIFASGRLAAQPPPLPEFFEQYHVLVTPMLAPKYPPGHALLLVPGLWLKLPGLMPVVLSGVSGGLLFALVRRLGNPWVAALAWVVWLTAPGGMGWRGSYFSESTTGALWLAACWVLLDWTRSERPRSLALLAILMAGCVLTRPLTAIGLAPPIALVVLRRVWARRAWAPLALASGAALGVLAIIPVWNSASTGHWWRVPYAYYSELYFPNQKLGFGFDATPPRRALPPDMERFYNEYRPLYLEHTLSSLPKALWQRTDAVLKDIVGFPWRWPLGIVGLVGLVGLGPAGLFALLSAVSLILAYLVFAHPPHWTVYYQEILPVLAWLVARGAWRLLNAERDHASPAAGRAAPAVGMALLSLGILARGTQDARSVRESLRLRGSYHRAAAAELARIPARKAIVFIRYAPQHTPHLALVQNPPDYDRARLWLAYDRGPDDHRLMRLAPDRTPYLFDEASWSLYRLASPESAEGPERLGAVPR